MWLFLGSQVYFLNLNLKNSCEPGATQHGVGEKLKIRLGSVWTNSMVGVAHRLSSIWPSSVLSTWLGKSVYFLLGETVYAEGYPKK